MPITQVRESSTPASGVASAEGVFEVLDASEEIPDTTGRDRSSSPRPDHHGERGPSGTSGQAADRGSRPRGRPGTRWRIVGPTGAGKTTLVNLLMRFYEIEAADHRRRIDVRELTGTTCGARFGMVLQDTWLFADDQGEHPYGAPRTDGDRLLAVARAAYVDHVLRTLPRRRHGAGRGGLHLSAGEKQLLTIAGRSWPTHRAHPRRGHQLGRPPHRGAHPEGDGPAAPGQDQLRHRARLSTVRDADTILVMDATDRRAGTHRRCSTAAVLPTLYRKGQFSEPRRRV